VSSGAFEQLAKHYCNSLGKYRSYPASTVEMYKILSHTRVGRRRTSAGAQMRRGKSLLLGTAAAFVAAAGAQAADMPVKAARRCSM
jgi:hypothetical protein